MNFFIVGAGLTKALFPDAPLNNELFHAISNENSENAIQYLENKYDTSDIEIALTMLDLDIVKSLKTNKSLHSKLVNIRKDIEFALFSFFSRFNVNDDLLTQNRWYGEFLSSIFSIGDTILSLNYDHVIESALDCMGKWTPNRGYGSLKNDLAEGYPPSPVKVLKIHGSTTFVSAPYLDKPECNAISFEFDEKYFPKSAEYSHIKFGLDKAKPYFIPPSFVKIPSVEMVRLMLDSLKEASKTDKLIIVGCSLRPEDSFLTLLLTHYIREKKEQNPHIIILDLNADNISSRICDYWGTNIKEHIISINGNIQNSINILRNEINK